MYLLRADGNGNIHDNVVLAFNSTRHKCPRLDSPPTKINMSNSGAEWERRTTSNSGWVLFIQMWPLFGNPKVETPSYQRTGPRRLELGVRWQKKLLRILWQMKTRKKPQKRNIKDGQRCKTPACKSAIFPYDLWSQYWQSNDSYCDSLIRVCFASLTENQSAPKPSTFGSVASSARRSLPKSATARSQRTARPSSEQLPLSVQDLNFPLCSSFGGLQN